MRKNILIYGFGWTGKATLELCETMGCACKVIDDGNLLEREGFISYETLKESLQYDSQAFDAYLIAISGKTEIIQKIKDKLLSIKSVGGGNY